MTKSFINALVKVVSKKLHSIEFTVSYPTINLRPISNKELLFFVNFLKNNSAARFNNLTELTVIDTPGNVYRFELILVLTSVEFNTRVMLQIPINDTSIISLTSVYANSSWSEREVRDMFGIHFTNNNDLRRLLTDYGFEGFPLRKDFPLTGYLEARYDDTYQRITYEPVELAQELRVFNLSSPWEKK